MKTRWTTCLNVVDNDLPPTGAGPYTIQSVGLPDNGGEVEIVLPDRRFLRYTPAPNFAGTETFTYTVVDQNNRTSTATVTVTVREPAGRSDSPRRHVLQHPPWQQQQ